MHLTSYILLMQVYTCIVDSPGKTLESKCVIVITTQIFTKEGVGSKELYIYCSCYVIFGVRDFIFLVCFFILFFLVWISSKTQKQESVMLKTDKDTLVLVVQTVPFSFLLIKVGVVLSC